MVDADTGQVIYQQNIDQKLPIASVSKLLTACVIEDEVAHHQLSWHQKIKITQAVAAVSNDPDYSAVGLQAGQSYTVRGLFDVMLVKSADGAALALATANGKTIKQFNTKMVKKAKQIGLRNGNLKQVTQKGIKKQSENAMTARDVAILSRYLIRHYPQVLNITKRPQENFTVSPGKVVVADNSNEMLTGKKYEMPNIAIDGLKTGTSDKAGEYFVSTGMYHGHRMIMVVLHANGGDGDLFVDTQRLYHYLQNNVHPRRVTLSHRQAHPEIARGDRKRLAVGVAPVDIWQDSKFHYRLQVHYRQKLTNFNGQLVSPVKKGQRLGSATIESKSLKMIDKKPLTVNLYSKETIKRHGLFN